MSLSFLAPSRCVLLVGDDALYVYDINPREARLVDAVSWDTSDFARVVADLLDKECSGKSVLILNDMTDQHFKGGQRLPKVGLADRKGVLERKLAVAFPNYPIRGALSVKEAKSRNESEKTLKKISSGVYLYAAVPMSEPVTKTMEAVKKSLLPISGFFLLPVESADMVKTLATRLAGKKQKANRWVIFIGQHHSGALRQVIIRDGQLAMTRMTPAVDTDPTPSSWAEEMSQEFKATISYLSRFGFTPDDGVDVIVICSPEAGQILERMIDVPCQYTHLMASEAARELGLNIGVQEDSRYADPLHAAWVGRKTRFILPMKAPDLEKTYRLRQAASFAIMLLMLGAGYFGLQLANQAQAMMTFDKDLRQQKDIMVQVSQDYEREVERMKAIGFDVKVIRGAIKTYEKMERERLNTLGFVGRIGEALGEDIHLDALLIEYTPPAPEQEFSYDYGIPQEEGNPKIKAALKIRFPSSIEPAAGVRQVNNLRRRLQGVFPEYNVVIEKNVAGLEYSDNFSGATGQVARNAATEDYVAELVIRGEIK